MSSIDERQRPHAVCVPFPAQGHITPMLKLAKILHHKGFFITFINTEYNQRRLIKAGRTISSLDVVDDFRFETIPDGLPYSDDCDVTQDIPSLCDSTMRNCLAPFREVLDKINKGILEGPKVSCIVSDGAMSFTLDAAEELQVPEVIFWTTSACGFMGYLHYKELIARGITPFKGELPLFLSVSSFVVFISTRTRIPLPQIIRSYPNYNGNNSIVRRSVGLTRAMRAIVLKRKN